jgi:hypothetical protein
VQQELLRGIGIVTELATLGTLHAYLHTDAPLFVELSMSLFYSDVVLALLRLCASPVLW